MRSIDVSQFNEISSPSSRQRMWVSHDGSEYVKEQLIIDGIRYKDYLVEVLGTKICEQLNMGNVSYVTYEPCSLGDTMGCVSDNFLDAYMELYTFEDYMPLEDLSDSALFKMFRKELSRLKCRYYDEYLALVFLVDYLLSNTDRFLWNLAVVQDTSTGVWYPAPLFDFGRGLLQDRYLPYVNGELTCAPYSQSFDAVLKMYKEQYNLREYLPAYFDVQDWVFPSAEGYALFKQRCQTLGVSIQGECIVLA